MSGIYVNFVSISNLSDKNGVSTFINGFDKIKVSFESQGVIINKFFTAGDKISFNYTKDNVIFKKGIIRLSAFKNTYLYKLFQFLYLYIYQALKITFRLLHYYKSSFFNTKHVYFFNDIFVCFFALIFLPKGMKSVIIFHSSDDPLCDFFILFPFKKTSLIGKFVIYILDFVSKNSDFIVTLSKNYSEKLILEHPSKSVRCIYNTSFLDDNKFQFEKSISNFQLYNIDILSVGSLQYRKGFDMLISAIASLPVALKNRVCLRIAGDGEFRKNLEGLIYKYDLQNNVFLLGNVDNIRNLLTECDVFCLPSREEGLPIALIEALSLHKPVICTQVGSIPEIFDSSDCIFIEQDPDDISRVLINLFNNLDLLDVLSNKSGVLFNNLFSNCSFVNSYSLLFKEASM